METVIVVAGVAVIVVPILVLIALSIRKENRRVASLSDEERRREAAIKRWGNKRRGRDNADTISASNNIDNIL